MVAVQVCRYNKTAVGVHQIWADMAENFSLHRQNVNIYQASTWCMGTFSMGHCNSRPSGEHFDGICRQNCWLYSTDISNHITLYQPQSDNSQKVSVILSTNPIEMFNRWQPTITVSNEICSSSPGGVLTYNDRLSECSAILSAVASHSMENLYYNRCIHRPPVRST